MHQKLGQKIHPSQPIAYNLSLSLSLSQLFPFPFGVEVENEDQRILWSCTTRYDDGAARRSAGGGGRDVQSGGVKPVSRGNNDGDAAVTSLL